MLFILPLLLAAPAYATGTSFQFSGTVEEGRDFTHALPGGLYFHLIPTADGWKMTVNKNPKAVDPSFNQGEENYSDITPPLYGSNPTNIIADHVKNQNSTPVPRPFEFSLTMIDNQSVWAEYNCALQAAPVHTKPWQQPQQDEPCNDPLPPPAQLGYGTLQITEYKTAQNGGTDHMAFTVNGDFEAPRGIGE